ncbi:hypothetical protein BDQ17DRAFT_1371923 [Cyathus striatus]|nr:hypothetical protein BDQ17DRAFT_1371923 [Cyathus striatus]
MLLLFNVHRSHRCRPSIFSVGSSHRIPLSIGLLYIFLSSSNYLLFIYAYSGDSDIRHLLYISFLLCCFICCLRYAGV